MTFSSSKETGGCDAIKSMAFKNSRTAQSSAMDLIDHIQGLAVKPDSQIIISDDKEFGHCPECQTKFPLNRDIELFPVNKALLQLSMSLQPTSPKMTSLKPRHSSTINGSSRNRQVTPSNMWGINAQLDDDQTTLKNSALGCHRDRESEVTSSVKKNGLGLTIDSDGISLRRPARGDDLRALDPRGNIVCQIHEKDVQAFCGTEHLLLCIECLIQGKDQHKDHDVQTITDAFTTEKSNLLAKAEEAGRLEQAVRG